MASPSKASIGMEINTSTIAELAKLVAAGHTFFVSATPPTGYTRQFQHQDWVDFVDPVQAGGDNGINSRFHGIEREFDLISAAITSVDDAVTNLQGSAPGIGMTLVLAMSDGATIPVPTGFQASETKFFAFVKSFLFDPNRTQNEFVGFNVYADDNGKVTARLWGTEGQSVVATGLAIAKKGGW